MAFIHFVRVRILLSSRLGNCLLTRASYVQRNRDVLDPTINMKRSDYGLPEDKFLFACFNQLYKMDPEIFSTW